MAEQTTCNELAAKLGSTPQKVYYHVKALEQAGLVEKVAERKVRGILEGIYQARAKSYWLSPQLVGRIGGARRARDQASLGYLISLAEEIQEDVARLAASQTPNTEVPSLGVAAQIELSNASRRAEFMTEVRELFQSLAAKYGATTRGRRGEVFRLALACYPERRRSN
jgi:DNA-binding transcriptional ArsR family regulator